MICDNKSSLKFEFIANACGIFTGKDGTKILCDPWIMDGVFDGSWCHCPKINTSINDIKSIDAIYISHLHPDHFDDRYFNFDKQTPLIVLDHGPNFLIKNLEKLGYNNLIRIKDHQTEKFREFNITMFAPFAKHNFHEAEVGNLIDSAILINCEDVSALNANDNTLTLDSARYINKTYGRVSLAMLNYNAAGPYPSCFDNLTELEKISEHNRILERNFNHMLDIILTLQPTYVLPFAGAYVLGGDLCHKNKYLGTTTWDDCANWFSKRDISPTKIVLLRENDVFDIQLGTSNKEYMPLNMDEMNKYITNVLSKLKYPYQLENAPNKEELIHDVALASDLMIKRMSKFGISSKCIVTLDIFGQKYQIYPVFSDSDKIQNSFMLECKMDERLLRNILDRKSHWNNAEIGAHISFMRQPNKYEPDLHMGLQFFHL
jgi:UDP-MurNAc hydroxylase